MPKDEQSKTNLLEALNSRELGPSLTPEPQEPVEHEPAEIQTREPAPIEPREPPSFFEPTESQAPTPPAARAADVKKYKFGDRELTLAEAEAQGLIQGLIQTAEQLPAVQRKYIDLLEKQRAATAEPQPPAQPPAKLSQAQIRSAYTDQLQQAIADGYMEADFAEMYPDIATQMLFHRDLLYEARETIAALVGAVNRMAGTTKKTEMETHLDNAFDALAEKDKRFGMLKDAKTRAGFMEYLDQLNPEADQLTGEKHLEFLERQFWAYNGAAILEAQRLMGGNKQKEANPRVSGDGSGARPTTPSAPQPKKLLEQLNDSVLGAS